MTLSREEWLDAMMEANAKANAISFIVQALNQFHESYQGDLEFYLDKDGHLEAAVCGCIV